MIEKNASPLPRLEPLPQKLAAFFDTRPKAQKILISFLLLLLIGYLDHETGEEIGSSFFYIFPVAFTAWFLGGKYGLAFSGISSMTAYINVVVDETKFSHSAIPFWNAFLVHMSALMLVSYLLSHLRFILEHERKTRLDAVSDSKLKSMMVSLVSHEFGNALAQIGPAAFLLREGEGETVTKEREALYTVLDKVQQNLKALVGNFLNLSRLESGNFVVPDKEIDIVKLTINSLEIFSLLLEEKKIQVNFDHPAKIPPVTGDSEAIGLVLHNLIGNAIKYTPPDGLVTVKIVPPISPGDKLFVSIEDTGIGVPKEDSERIFSGFYRSSESAKIARGIGVGLKVSREIINHHSGELKMEARPQKGSRFYFSLPYRK